MTGWMQPPLLLLLGRELVYSCSTPALATARPRPGRSRRAARRPMSSAARLLQGVGVPVLPTRPFYVAVRDGICMLASAVALVSLLRLAHLQGLQGL